MTNNKLKYPDDAFFILFIKMLGTDFYNYRLAT